MEKNSGVEENDNRIAVIILNWKNIDATVECIESVAASHDIIPEIFLLDNGTNKEAFTELRKRLNEINLKIYFFASYQNLGFAGGVNYVINQVNLDEYPAIFLLNNDAKVTESTLHVLLKESQETGVQMLGAKSQSTKYGPSRKWPRWLFGLRFPQKYEESKKRWPTCYISGSGLFVTKGLAKNIINQRGSLLKDNYFLYGEDTELGLYAQELGIQSYITSKATLIHKRGSYNTEKRRMLTYYYTTRNRFYLCRDYLSSLLKPLFHFYYPLSRLLIVSYRFLKGEYQLAIAIIEGLKDGYSEEYGKWKKHPE